MSLTDAQKRTLLARSRSLRERLAHSHDASGSPSDPAIAATRETRWRQVTTKGDPASFARLLLSRNIEPASLDRLLGTPHWPDGMDCPDWIRSIDAVIAQASQPHHHGDAADASFFAPFCAVAHARLQRDLPEHTFALSAHAYQALLDNLKHALQFVCQSALDAGAVPDQAQSLSNGSQRAEHLTAFLLEYSVAARAAATLMQRWHDNTLALVLRLTADARAIELRFLDGAPLGELVRVECGLSDPHNGGQSVMRLHFASGLRLVYKPRSVALDLAYNNLLDWLAQNGSPHPLRKPAYLAHASYAWIEQIDHVPCQSREELLQFCHSAGALMCISYLLDATDLHDGNLIATPTAPVIVDLETLLQPRLAEPQSQVPQDALRKAAMLADRSILRTGLLPSLKLGADGQAADVGCLGSLFAAHSADWYQHEPAASPFSGAMRDALDAGTLDPMGLADGVASGFRQTYLFLLSKRRDLLDANGPLQGFKCKPVRFLLRDTSVYIKLLRPSLSALALREGVDRSIALESLYRLVHQRPSSQALEALVAEEIAALENLDIPLLSATTDSIALHSAEGSMGPDIFEQPSYDAMLKRFHGFSEQDLNGQLEFLHGSFAARSAGSHSIAPPVAVAASADTAESDTLSAASQAIATALRERAVIGDDGSAAWMAPVPIPNTRFFRFDILPLDMASGIIGIAFFLAAYSHTTGDRDMGTVARQAVQTVAQRLQIDTDSYTARHSTASIHGMGSVLYALHRIGTFLGDPTIGATVQRLALRFSDVGGASLPLPGSLSDCSELCLGLMALNKQEPAAQLGQQLHVHWNRLDGERRSAAVRTAPHLALCWLRLQEMTHDVQFLRACTETLQTLYQATNLIAAQQAPLHFALLSCHPGLQETGLAHSLNAQMDALRHAEPAHSDNLQEGNCSMAERLLTAAGVLNRPELLSAARRTADGLVQRAKLMGGYQTIPGMPRGTFLPGFSQGLGGIGYALLRQQSNAQLPCVSLWD